MSAFTDANAAPAAASPLKFDKPTDSRRGR